MKTLRDKLNTFINKWKNFQLSISVKNAIEILIKTHVFKTVKFSEIQLIYEFLPYILLKI